MSCDWLFPPTEVNRPSDAIDCSICNGAGVVGSPGIDCHWCRGKGWSEELTKAARKREKRLNERSE